MADRRRVIRKGSAMGTLGAGEAAVSFGYTAVPYVPVASSPVLQLSHRGLVTSPPTSQSGGGHLWPTPARYEVGDPFHSNLISYGFSWHISSDMKLPVCYIIRPGRSMVEEKRSMAEEAVSIHLYGMWPPVYHYTARGHRRGREGVEVYGV